jgi:hypothetical protein
MEGSGSVRLKCCIDCLLLNNIKQADTRTLIERVQSSKKGPSTSSTDPAPQHEETAEPSKYKGIYRSSRGAVTVH